MQPDAARIDRTLSSANTRPDLFTPMERAWLNALRNGLNKHGDRLPYLMDGQQWGMVERAAERLGSET